MACRSLRAVAVVLFASALPACSALIDPDTGRLGPDDGADSGVSLMDSGMSGFDAGPGFDGGNVPCVEGTRRCSGDTLVTCAGGALVPQDCQAMMAFCDGDHCQPHVCRPNSRMCSPDGTSVLSCTARGDDVDAEDCGDGRCDPATFRCEGGGGPCDALNNVRIGEDRTANLCGRDDDNSRVPGGTCGGTSRSDTGDITYRLTLTEPTRVTIELTDIAESTAVDTVVYVRRVCDDETTQVLCSDDVPCEASTAEPPACIDGVDPRQSRVTADLPAGSYYVVVDAFEYTSGSTEFRCGQVRLRITESPASPFPGG